MFQILKSQRLWVLKAAPKAAFNLIDVFQFDDYSAQGKTYLEVLAKTPPTSDVKIGISGNT